MGAACDFLELAHGRTLARGEHGLLMGVLNVTPDSFSDGGLYVGVEAAVDHARLMASQGARIVDIGAESTRPGADPISVSEEQARLLPVVSGVAKALPDIIISVDTYHSESAALAIAAGAHMINDVWGLHKSDALARVVAQTGAGLMIMHTNRDRAGMFGDDVIEDQRRFFSRSLEIANTASVSANAIMLDPGFGFGKDAHHNYSLLARFSELVADAALGQYWWGVGTSRKRMIGHATGRGVENRDVGTAATTAMLRMAGATVFRVHDVAINADALAVADATIKAQEVGNV